MRKFIHSNQQFILWLLVLLLVFPISADTELPMVYAQETSGTPETIGTQETTVSLGSVSTITADTPDRVLRICGEEGMTYNVPIQVVTGCTIILDHMINEADLTVTEGATVRICLRGENALGNIVANGGAATTVRIEGESTNDSLSASEIACPEGGTTKTGAVLSIDQCTVSCQNLGCGNNGSDQAYPSEESEDIMIPLATPGSNASPYVSIARACLEVSKSIACGGMGARSIGTNASCASDGGNSGEVTINASEVTVGGHLALGGKGGEGAVNNKASDYTSGLNKSASPVTITNSSRVTVTGNVATQYRLPYFSKDGTQDGLDGVTVVVMDSILTARDIANGGNGHCRTLNLYKSSDGVTIQKKRSTAGGDGGKLIAKNATITCESAVCGGKAGEYCDVTSYENGYATGDLYFENHPLDGNGGVILSDNSQLTITEAAGTKGKEWDGKKNPSVYGNSEFFGGSLNGTVYADVITTDLTSILGGGFVAATAIRNSKSESCVLCELQTEATMAGQPVQAEANTLSEETILNSEGSLCTYLGTGEQVVQLTGQNQYGDTLLVTQTPEENTFLLKFYRKMTSSDSPDITGDSTGAADDSQDNPEASTGAPETSPDAAEDSTDVPEDSKHTTDDSATVIGGSTGDDHESADIPDHLPEVEQSPSENVAPKPSDSTQSQPEPQPESNHTTVIQTRPLTHDQTSDAHTDEPITMEPSLEELKLMEPDLKNTYQTYVREKVSLTITREKNTDYYYKVLKKGQKNAAVAWKKLRTDTITVKPQQCSEKGNRIYIKAVSETGTVIKKTSGFVMDTKKPTVSGVKNASFYHDTCTINVKDNCGLRSVSLNGKKMSKSFTVKKRGLYLLTATDKAGNEKHTIFAIL